MSETTEQRRDQRQRTVHAGKVVYGDFRFMTDCIVRDLSEHGARIKVPDGAEVPERFHLFETRDHTLTPARSVWREGREIGIEFAGTPVNVFESKDQRLARFRYL